MRSTLLAAIFVSTTFLSAAIFAKAPEKSWPTFRGTERTAVASETNLLTKWPEGGPKLLWESAGAGRGYSSLAIVDGKIYTLGDAPSTADDQDEYLLCFNLKDGKPLWKLKTGEAWNSGKPTWQSSRSTPTVDGDRVYVLTPFGMLVCASTDGTEIWRRDLKNEFDGKKADSWGYSESVLIDGNKVVCTPGGPENTMVALNKNNGEKIWSSQRPEDRGAGHASIAVANIGGVKVYVTTTGSGAMGVRAEDGKLLWVYDFERTTAVIPSPIVRDDLVFFVAGYRRGGALVWQKQSGNGEVEIEEIYPLNPDLANKHGGVVLIADHLYGDSDDRGILYCADLMTGKVVWKHRGSGHDSAAVAAADGHLYVRYANGTMTLVKANPEKFEEVGSFTIPDSGDRPSWSHPVIFDGKLYLREGDKLLCYDVQA